jgi:hypothetical protein
MQGYGIRKKHGAMVRIKTVALRKNLARKCHDEF